MCRLPACFLFVQDKNAPLHEAASKVRKGREETCLVLIAKGADVNAQNEVMRGLEGVGGRAGGVDGTLAQG